MRCFTIHRRDTGLFTEPDTVLVKEGFSWPAFFLTFVWALWHRMWLTAVAIAAAQIAAGLIAGWLRLNGLAEFWLVLGMMLVIGFGANDWRRRSLAWRGYDESGIVCGRDLGAAELRLLKVEQNGGIA